MKTKLDETNLAIIKALRNGRASFRDIAADLGLSEVTVRTRAARLIEDGVLDICGQVDVEKLPGHTLALVAIKLRSPDLVGEGEVFSHLRGVVSVAVLTGRHDLILTVLLNEEFGLLDFYTNEFSKCHDRVSSIETFIVYKGFSLEGALYSVAAPAVCGVFRVGGASRRLSGVAQAARDFAQTGTVKRSHSCCIKRHYTQRMRPSAPRWLISAVGICLSGIPPAR